MARAPLIKDFCRVLRGSSKNHKRDHNKVKFLLILPAVFLLISCGEVSQVKPDSINIVEGDSQAGAPESEGHPLRVEVLGPRREGLLGGRGRRQPAAGATVLFETVNKDSGIEFTAPNKVETDAGGYAETEFRYGAEFGDRYIRATVKEQPDLSVDFRVISGMEKFGDGQEALAGEQLPEPLGVKLYKPDGSLAEGVPVYFRISSQPGDGAALENARVLSDAEGKAKTTLRTDEGVTGKYEITAEVACGETLLSVRSVVFGAMSLSPWRVVIGVLGGLGIFIFGMQTMSGGLRQLAGNKLRSFLHFFTRNRFSAVGSGTLITGLIQSSTACTVMVVGFVNAGLLTLQQSLGVVLGANIGTTVTGQIISLNIQQLALPAIIIGVAGIMISRRLRTRNIFQAVMGFGLLFLGMQMMSGELRSISSLPSFIEVFQLFDCQPGADGVMPLWPVLGAMAIGTVMTVLVQSSTATIGLTIALSVSGLINFYTAVPLILGDNIGTTITALLASIGANRRARQAALGHTIFNLFGAAYMLGLFYVTYDGTPVFLHLVDMVTAGEVFAAVPENIGRHVASAHTLFNVFNVLVFLPLLPFVAVVCNFVLPVKEEDEMAVVPLEPHLLSTPSIALRQAMTATGTMTEAAWKLAWKTVEGFREGKCKDEENLRQQESGIDEMQKQTIHYLTELTRQPLSEAQAETIPLLIHCVNDAERIGDHGIDIMDLAQELKEDKLKVSGKADRDIGEIVDLLDRQAQEVVAALADSNQEQPHMPNRAVRLQGSINQRIQAAEKKHLKRLEKGKCSVGAGIFFTELLTHLERIANHLSNIAERITEIKQKYQDGG